MNERSTDVLSAPPADLAASLPRPRRPHPADRVVERGEYSAPVGTAGCSSRGREPSREPLSPRPDPGRSGGSVPSDDELLERTVASSGTYVSDDGSVTIRRSAVRSFEYSGDRFIGTCRLCSRAHLIPPTGAPLPDVRAAVRFIVMHNHGDLD
jgi:hypothetical protein